MRVFFNGRSDVGLDGFNGGGVGGCGDGGRVGGCGDGGGVGGCGDGGGVCGCGDGGGFVGGFVGTKRRQFVIGKQIDIFNTGLF